MNDPLDTPFLLEMSDRTTSKRTVDLHAIDQGGGRDHSVGRDFLHDLVARYSHQDLYEGRGRGKGDIQDRLVEDDGVVGLVLDLPFRPLLLLTAKPVSDCTQAKCVDRRYAGDEIAGPARVWPLPAKCSMRADRDLPGFRSCLRSSGLLS